MNGRERSRSKALLRAALAAGLCASAWACASGVGRRAAERSRPRGGADDEAPALADSCPATRGQVVMELVNRYRRAEGMVPLRVDARLVEAAIDHARDLTTLEGTPAHAGSDGSEPADRATRVGYPWKRVGENVAAAVPSAASVVGIWMNSTGHRHNILTPEFEDAGVGYVDVPGSQWGTYWVMVYGTPSSDAPEHRVSCHP